MFYEEVIKTISVYYKSQPKIFRVCNDIGFDTEGIIIPPSTFREVKQIRHGKK